MKNLIANDPETFTYHTAVDRVHLTEYAPIEAISLVFAADLGWYGHISRYNQKTGKRYYRHFDHLTNASRIRIQALCHQGILQHSTIFAPSLGRDFMTTALDVNREKLAFWRMREEQDRVLRAEEATEVKMETEEMTDPEFEQYLETVEAAQAEAEQADIDQGEWEAQQARDAGEADFYAHPGEY